MNLAIIGSKTHENKRILDESKNFFEKAQIISLSDVVIVINDSVNFYYKGQNLLNDYDAFLIRGTGKYHRVSALLANLIDARKKVLIDDKLAHPVGLGPKFGTLAQLSQNKILVPETFQAYNESEIIKWAEKLGYPLIVKNIMGLQGRGIYKIESSFQLRQFIKEHKDSLEYFLFQKFISSSYDVRVIVIGGKIIGAMKRISPAGDFRSNIAVGGKAENYNLNKEIQDLALKTNQVIKNDIVGIDIMFGKKPYIIEVNRAPQFRTFEKITKINVAKEICQFIYQKVKNN